MSEAREDPSPRKIARSVREGRVPRSGVLVGVFGMLLGFGVLWASADAQVEAWGEMAQGVLRSAGTVERPEDAAGVVESGWSWLLWCCAPVMVAVLGGSIVGNLVSYRPIWAPGLLSLSLDRFQRGSSPAIRATTWLSVLGFLAGCAWIGRSLWDLVGETPGWPSLAAKDSLALLLRVGGGVWWPLMGILVALGLADLFVQRRSWWEGMKMTRAEVEEEARDQRQDPSLSRERSRLLRSERGFGLHRVAEASLLVFYESAGAVALWYEPGKPPQVVAVTRDADQAARLLSVARAQGRPLWRDEALTGALGSLEEGSFVPEALFRAVAFALKNASDRASKL